MSRPPLWRQTYDRVERAVAPRLEAGVRTGMFASTLATVTKARAELSRRGSQLAGRLGTVSTRSLHLVNTAYRLGPRVVIRQQKSYKRLSGLNVLVE